MSALIYYQVYSARVKSLFKHHGFLSSYSFYSFQTVQSYDKTFVKQLNIVTMKINSYLNQYFLNHTQTTWVFKHYSYSIQYYN